MRTINAFECWPFDSEKELTHENIRSMLPPMDISMQESETPEHNEKRKSKKLNKRVRDVDIASTSGEKSLTRSKLRRRTIEEIFNGKKDDKKLPSSPVVILLQNFGLIVDLIFFIIRNIMDKRIYFDL
jgi:hypothetical protein